VEPVYKIAKRTAEVEGGAPTDFFKEEIVKTEDKENKDLLDI
jgi:hypothetical protein